jgi:hypothetical protein
MQSTVLVADTCMQFVAFTNGALIQECVTNSMEKSFSERLLFSQVVMKFPAFYGTITFIAALRSLSLE